MSTTATPEELAERREDVNALESCAVAERTQLIETARATGPDAGQVDYLAGQLTRTVGELRRARNILNDMVSGAGDWHACDSPACCGLDPEWATR